MFWTGIRRDATAILSEQQRNTPQKLDLLHAMRAHAQELQGLLRNGFDPLAFGRVLDESWQLKRRLASTITTPRIDGWYEQGRRAGAVGGKLCGAGGGGFLLFVMPPESKTQVRAAMRELAEVPIRYEAQGSRVLLPVVE
jgi:D-glycero-alpha-D-manno-heptose-7-phosphate kinase